MALQSHGPQQAGRPWIGLEHTNKVSSGLDPSVLKLIFIAGQQKVAVHIHGEVHQDLQLGPTLLYH